MKKSRIPISDHAVLRYLERVQGMDIEHIRRTIGARVDDAARQGACGIIIDGFSYKIEDGFITVTSGSGASAGGAWSNECHSETSGVAFRGALTAEIRRDPLRSALEI